MLEQSQMQQIRQHFERGSNILRKLFKENRSTKGQRVDGYSLNGNALTRSFVSARSCRENNDRYHQTVRKPQTTCAFSFAIDFSGSMSASPSRKGDSFLGRASSWERVIATSHALCSVADKVGIKSKVGFVQFEENSFQITLIKDLEQKAWDDEYARNLTFLSPNDGTDVSHYARASIYMLENVQAMHKVAFFLTDGEDNRFDRYNSSLNQLADSMGITLVGIAFSQQTRLNLPNGIVCTDTKELGDQVFKHLEKIILGR